MKPDMAGAFAETQGIEAGITVATGMLQTGTIESNRIRGAAHGLLLQPSGPFGARIAGNDLVGSTVSGVGVGALGNC